VSRFNRTDSKTAFARHLRQGSTDVESRLWQRLRRNQMDGCGFRRQHPAGPYTLDFYCPSLRLAIELDGGQHNERPQAVRDGQRDAWLSARGVTILRFWNSDLTTNFAGVLDVIAAKLSELKMLGVTPTRRWRADLPLSGGGATNSRLR
jgi:very-short-patch-repair endonuclease